MSVAPPTGAASRVIPREQVSGAARAPVRVSDQKIPRYLQFVDSYLMTASGKVQKFILRKNAIEALGLEDAAKIRTA